MTMSDADYIGMLQFHENVTLTNDPSQLFSMFSFDMHRMTDEGFMEYVDFMDYFIAETEII